MAKSKNIGKTAATQELVGLMMYGVSVGMPMTNIPQLQQLYATKVTAGLSLFTWVMYALLGLIPLAYAVINNLKPLIISNILWLMVEVMMIYGIIIYSPGMLPHDYERLLLINNIGKAIGYLGLFSISLAFAFFAMDLFETEKGTK